MLEPDDITLLREYAEKNSEAAFAALAERHVNLVYSTALRRTGSPHAAEEITQAVFIVLANKARSLSGKTVLAGWLYHTARLTAANFLRGEIRRQQREQEAHMQSLLNESPVDETWTQIAPLLEDAMAKLGERDRDALVLRFFENKNLREIGAAIGTNEDAAKMRVHRALEKLRKTLEKHGVRSTTAVIAGAVSAHSIHAAPLGLAKTISAVAIAKEVAVAGGSTMALAKGVLKVMAWTKAKIAVVVGVGLLLAAGTTTVAVKEITRDDSWRVGLFNSDVLEKAKPQVRILPAKSSPGGYGTSLLSHGGFGIMGIAAPVKGIVAIAYDANLLRTIFPTDMPAGNYDFISKLPPGSKKAADVALQEEVKKKFGLVAHRETREIDVLLLTAQNHTRPGLKTPAPQNGSFLSWDPTRELRMENQPIQTLANLLENNFQEPIIDRTGIEGSFDVYLRWKVKDPRHPDLGALKQALSDELGLELVPGRAPMGVLVVEKAN
jgi:uncharacterized protein (TIGR03435 family)